ncbi:MAG: hypothetical protein ACKO0M_12880, partial [Cyanobium sp.]
LLLLLRRRPPDPLLPPEPFCPHWSGMLRWFAFLVPLLLLQHLIGVHTLLLPPLIVISHELLVTPGHAPWRSRSWPLLPVAFGSSAAIGLVAAHGFPHAPGLGTAAAMFGSLLLLRRLDQPLPPVHAMAVLPQLLPQAGPAMVVGVLVGSVFLVLVQRCGERFESWAISPGPGAGQTGRRR